MGDRHGGLGCALVEEGCHVTNAALGHLDVIRVEFDADIGPSEFFADHARGARAVEGVKDDIAGARAREDAQGGDLFWEGGEVANLLGNYAIMLA